MNLYQENPSQIDAEKNTVSVARTTMTTTTTTRELGIKEENALKPSSKYGPLTMIRSHTSTSLYQQVSGDPRLVVIKMTSHLKKSDVLKEQSSKSMRSVLNLYSYAYLMSNLKPPRARELQRLVAEKGKQKRDQEKSSTDHKDHETPIMLNDEFLVSSDDWLLNEPFICDEIES